MSNLLTTSPLVIIDRMSKERTQSARVNINARVDPKNLKRFDELAKERRWSRSELVDYLVEEFVKSNPLKSPRKS